jgi:transcriptional regulator with XRE-family HTH domain
MEPAIDRSLQEIGSLIRAKRAYLKLSREELEKLSGVPSSTIHLIEGGKGNSCIKNYLAIALALEIKIELELNFNYNERK